MKKTSLLLLSLALVSVSFGITYPAYFFIKRTSPTAPTDLAWSDTVVVHSMVDSTRAAHIADSCRFCPGGGGTPDSVRAAHIADTAKRAGWTEFSDSARASHLADSAKAAGRVDSSRVSGLSDSAKILVWYSRTSALHDTAMQVRNDAKQRISDSFTANPRSWAPIASVRTAIHDSLVQERHFDTVAARAIGSDTAGALRALITAREPSISAGTSGQFWSWDKTFRSITYAHITDTVPTWNQNTTGTARFADSSRASGIADTSKKAGQATRWSTARNLTIGACTRTLDGTVDRTCSLADIGAQAAGSYLPLGAGASYPLTGPLYAYYGTPTAEAIIIGDNQYGIYQASSALHLKGAAANGIVSDNSFYAPTLYEGGTSLAAKYQPLEDQRLSTTNSPTWNRITTGYGSSGVPGITVGEGNYGIYAGGGALHLRGAAAGGIVLDHGVTLSATGPGILQQASAGGVVTAGAVPVAQLPASIQTVQSGVAGQVPFSNGSSGFSYDSRVTVSPSTGQVQALTENVGEIGGYYASGPNSPLTVTGNGTNTNLIVQNKAGYDASVLWQSTMSSVNHWWVAGLDGVNSSGSGVGAWELIDGSASSNNYPISVATGATGHIALRRPVDASNGVHATGGLYSTSADTVTSMGAGIVQSSASGVRSSSYTVPQITVSGVAEASGLTVTGTANLAVTNITGTYKPHYVVWTASDKLPVVDVGEQITILFDASAITVQTNNYQSVDYRDATGGFAIAASGGSTVGTTGYFGTGATVRASAATLIGVNSSRARLVF